MRYRRKGFRPQFLLTSLLDEYEIKTHTLKREEALRSKSPKRVKQEVWGLAIAYNLMRHEMEDLILPPR